MVDPQEYPFIVEYVANERWQSEGFKDRAKAVEFVERQGPESRAHISIEHNELVNDQSTRVYDDPDEFLSDWLSADEQYK